MTHLQKAPRKPLFLNEKQGNTFVALFDDEIEQLIAKCIFVDGFTNEETAFEVGYCVRQIERKRKTLLEVALNMLVELRTPKKPRVDNDDWFCCPNCDETFSLTDILNRHNRYCGNCGQAILWE